MEQARRSRRPVVGAGGLAEASAAVTALKRQHLEELSDPLVELAADVASGARGIAA
jgi:hypothetical protein